MSKQQFANRILVPITRSGLPSHCTVRLLIYESDVLNGLCGFEDEMLDFIIIIIAKLLSGTQKGTNIIQQQ